MEKLTNNKFTKIEKILWWLLLVTSVTSYTAQHLLNTDFKKIDTKIQNLKSIPEPSNEEFEELINEIKQIVQKYSS